MTKRETIDQILAINVSAEPQFLARFADDQLFEYLTHLRVLSTPRLTGNADRYEKYFRTPPKIAGARPQWRCDTQHAEEISADGQADLACQAGPANDAQPAAPAVEPAQVPADATDTLGVGPDDWAADEADQGAQAAIAQDARCQELVAQDVDLAVGQAEREQLLSDPPELADAPAEDDDANDAIMEAPFKIAAPPRRTATTRATVSTAAKHMLYGADTPQPPPRPRRRAKSCAPAAAAAVAAAPQASQDDLDDEKWPY